MACPPFILAWTSSEVDFSLDGVKRLLRVCNSVRIVRERYELLEAPSHSDRRHLSARVARRLVRWDLPDTLLDLHAPRGACLSPAHSDNHQRQGGQPHHVKRVHGVRGARVELRVPRQLLQYTCRRRAGNVAQSA
jgi:hypothetical protein